MACRRAGGKETGKRKGEIIILRNLAHKYRSVFFGLREFERVACDGNNRIDILFGETVLYSAPDSCKVSVTLVSVGNFCRPARVHQHTHTHTVLYKSVTVSAHPVDRPPRIQRINNNIIKLYSKQNENVHTTLLHLSSPVAHEYSERPKRKYYHSARRVVIRI